MEKTAYVILLGLAVLWVVAIIGGLIAAFPFGLIGLIGIVAIGLLFIKVVKERLASTEDNYYDKHVDK